MKLTQKAQTVVNSLKNGRQPAKNTTKWILEGLEQALLIEWDHNNNKWGLVK